MDDLSRHDSKIHPVRLVSLDDVLDIVASEPEFPGEPIPEVQLWLAKESPTSAIRLGVRLTKAALIKRLEALANAS